MDRLLVILGPTATGKTDLSLQLAKKFNGELVAADSRQVYKGLDIGTGKLPGGRWNMENSRWKKGRGFWEIDGVKVWMVDVVSLDYQYTVADYVRDAQKIIKDILDRGNLPIVVGGTGFYIKALTEGLSNLLVPINLTLRGELEKSNVEELQKKLKLLSSVKYESLNESDRKNPRRLLRSIELVSMNPYINKYQVPKTKYQWKTLKIGLTAPRQVLYEKSDLRVLDWTENGILEEVKDIKILKRLGLEYGVIADFLEEKIKRKNLVKAMQNKLHGYIRRQITWFKRQENIHWFNITEIGFEGNVEKLIASWYDTPDAKKN